mmetsp:Transcript_5780/g.10111  ORF Transcript_5780/g.10111 Transcript_5780/m.10111 type:complete len:200 (-) Transcript_5780:1676-2275(-)
MDESGEILRKRAKEAMEMHVSHLQSVNNSSRERNEPAVVSIGLKRFAAELLMEGRVKKCELDGVKRQIEGENAKLAILHKNFAVHNEQEALNPQLGSCRDKHTERTLQKKIENAESKLENLKSEKLHIDCGNTFQTTPQVVQCFLTSFGIALDKRSLQRWAQPDKPIRMIERPPNMIQGAKEQLWEDPVNFPLNRSRIL